MNHKRRRPKHQRAGCLMCKPHKDERSGTKGAGARPYPRDPVSCARRLQEPIELPDPDADMWAALVADELWEECEVPDCLDCEWHDYAPPDVPVRVPVLA